MICVEYWNVWFHNTDISFETRCIAQHYTWTLPFWRKPFLLCTTRNRKGHAVFMWVSPIARWLVALLHSRICDQWLQPAKFHFSTNLYLKYLISNTITKAICKVMNFLISIPTDIIFATRGIAYYCTSFSANFPFLKKPFSLCIRLKIGRCVVKNWHQLTGHLSWANCSVALANLSKMSRSSLLNFIWSLIAGVLKQVWSLTKLTLSWSWIKQLCSVKAYDTWYCILFCTLTLHYWIEANNLDSVLVTSHLAWMAVSTVGRWGGAWRQGRWCPRRRLSSESRWSRFGSSSTQRRGWSTSTWLKQKQFDN